MGVDAVVAGVLNSDGRALSAAPSSPLGVSKPIGSGAAMSRVALTAAVPPIFSLAADATIASRSARVARCAAS